MEGGITAILHAVLLIFLIIELGLTAYRTSLFLLLLPFLVFLSTLFLVRVSTNRLSSRYHRLRLLPRRDSQLPAL